MLKKPLFKETAILFVLVATLNYVADVYHLYWSIYEFDSVVHFFAGAALASFFIWLYFYSGYFNPPRRSLRKFLLISFLGAMFVGFSWEIYEFIFKKAMVEAADYPYDTVMDLIMDFLGALVGSFYGYIKEHNIQAVIKNQNES